MATLNKIQAQLEKLIDDANQATGNTRTNITDGVEDLISGYGQGSANPTLQEKTATENGEVLPDEGYDGLSKVIVNVPNYVTVADEAELLNTTATDGTIAVITG